jgi:hypothetical protein
MEFKIEQGIPVAPKRSTRESIYPWAQCNPGDSFHVPCDEDKQNVRMSGVVASAKRFYAKQGLPFKAVSRVEDGGIRVWIQVVEEQEETPTEE